jgi:hypothetical protein
VLKEAAFFAVEALEHLDVGTSERVIQGNIFQRKCY